MSEQTQIKMNLKPNKESVLVPNPKTGKPLNINGEEVAYDRYWQRRIKEGDVVIAKAGKKTKTDKKT